MSQKGAKTQEYFVYFKFLQRICDAKEPPCAADAFNQRFLRLQRFTLKIEVLQAENLTADLQPDQ